MMGDLWLGLIITALGVLMAIGQLFVDHGKLGVRAQAVQVDKEALVVELARLNAERLSQLEANNISLSSKFAAIVEEYAKVIHDSILAKTELDITKLKLAASEHEVAELKTKVLALENENADLRARLEGVQRQLDAQKA